MDQDVLDQLWNRDANDPIVKFQPRNAKKIYSIRIISILNIKVVLVVQLVAAKT